MPQPATLYQHPRSPVTFNPPPPETPESIRAALDEHNLQRAHLRRFAGAPVTLTPYPGEAEPWDRTEAIQALVNLMAEQGAATVIGWAKSQAARMGVEVK
jgi:hypothetical protein